MGIMAGLLSQAAPGWADCGAGLRPALQDRWHMPASRSSRAAGREEDLLVQEGLDFDLFGPLEARLGSRSRPPSSRGAFRHFTRGVAR
jgi:hypothetical protein